MREASLPLTAFQNLLMQIDRILEINKLRTITKNVVEAARENLVIEQV